jgi:hypothetical protein
MTKETVRKEAERSKEHFPTMYFGSYELPNGEWQAVAAFDNKSEAQEVLLNQAFGRDWFLV